MIVMLTMVIMVGMLFSQSVLKHAYYIAEARSQQYASMEVAAQRGIIYAQDAEKAEPVILAESIQRFAVSATPRYVKHPDKVIPILAERFGITEDELALKLTYEGGTDWPDDKGNYTSPFAHGLTKEEVEALAAQIDPGTPVSFDAAAGDIIYFSEGIFFLMEYQRVYPENQLAAHVLGYVNYEGDGQYGFEEYHASDLEGTSGNVAVERDSRGRLLNEVGSVKGRDGYSYVLTIDSNIQYEAEKVLADAVSKYQADSGTVVIMQAKTGGVLAMASVPTFNPNEFAKVSKESVGVFRNPVVSSRYEFGSVYKPFTVSMALDNGLATPDERKDYPESVKIGEYTIHNALLKGYPNLSISEALENSVNTAMVDLSNRIGSERMHGYLEKLGFGEKTGIELSGETAGYLLPLEKMKDIQRATISFGQGIDTTPLQMTAAFTTIANDGVLVQPRIVDQIIHPDGTRESVEPKLLGQVFKPETAAQMRDMMTAVIVAGHGRQAGVRGYKVAGKTGTAQIPNPAGGYYEDRFLHSFVSIAPSDDPTFIIFISLYNVRTSRFAESSAAPAAGELMKYLLHYYQIPPTNR